MPRTALRGWMFQSASGTKQRRQSAGYPIHGVCASNQRPTWSTSRPAYLFARVGEKTLGLGKKSSQVLAPQHLKFCALSRLKLPTEVMRMPLLNVLCLCESGALHKLTLT